MKVFKKIFLLCLMALAAVNFCACDIKLGSDGNYNIIQEQNQSRNPALHNFNDFFSVSHEPYTKTTGKDFTKITIKNITNQSYYDVWFDLTFVSAAGSTEFTHDAGVYSHLHPNEEVSIYLKPFQQMFEDGDIQAPIAQIFVTDLKIDYFGVK